MSGEQKSQLEVWQTQCEADPSNSTQGVLSVDHDLMKRLISNTFENAEERSFAVARLCEVAATTGSVCVRANLARAAGYPEEDVEAYCDAIGADPKTEPKFTAKLRVMRAARAKRDEGDDEGFMLLSASVGYYPPELGNDFPDPRDKQIEKNVYDSQHLSILPIDKAGAGGLLVKAE